MVPAAAYRFRTTDSALAALLVGAGGELVAVNPDVEIENGRAPVGDAAFAVVVLGRPMSAGGPRAARAVKRLVRTGRVRLQARRARQTLQRLGYQSIEVLAWDDQSPVRGDSPPPRSSRSLAERLPQRALIVAGRDARPTTVLDAVIREAQGTTGLQLGVNPPAVRGGVLIADAGVAVLRLAIGWGSRQIESQSAALTALAAAGPSPTVAERTPRELASGTCGLATWSLEQRLPGSRPRPPLAPRLVSECVEFLVALHAAGSSSAGDGLFLEQADRVATVCAAEQASPMQALAERLEVALAEVPRGFAHGDFFFGNLLVERERLVGVVDWDAAGPARLAGLDLFHLLQGSSRDLADADWGPRLMDTLLPMLRAGGDHFTRAYCRGVGLDASPYLLEALAMAYWLGYVSYRLSVHRHLAAEPLWLERNISRVLANTTLSS